MWGLIRRITLPVVICRINLHSSQTQMLNGITFGNSKLNVTDLFIYALT